MAVAFLVLLWMVSVFHSFNKMLTVVVWVFAVCFGLLVVHRCYSVVCIILFETCLLVIVKRKKKTILLQWHIMKVGLCLDNTQKHAFTFFFFFLINAVVMLIVYKKSLQSVNIVLYAFWSRCVLAPHVSCPFRPFLSGVRWGISL